MYNLDARCGPITGHEIGKTGNGIVYEIPDIDSSIGIVLGYGNCDGHRATRIDYDANDALSMLFSDPNFIKEKLDNLNFPHSAKKIESYVSKGNKKIPVQLETKIEEPEKLDYIITFTEIWDTKDYSYDGCTQPAGNHYWRFKVGPNSYSDLDSGGNVPPQAEVNKEEAEKLIITVGPPGDKYSKAVKQGDTVEFIKRNQGEYAEIPIIIDTTSQQGISMEQDSILIDCDAGWGIWEGIPPGGFVRSFHVQTNNTSNAKFTIKKIFNNNKKNLLAEPLVFYVKIIDEPVHTKYIIDSVTEHPDFQYLPMPSSQLELYGFSTECFTLNNWVIAGYFTDNPKDGLIINYNLLKNDNPPYIHKVPNAGRITLTGINEDKSKLFFKTDNGKTGEFDVMSENGCYKIN